MSFPYKHVLLIGATSGIGAAMADEFIASGISVTAVGRRVERLKAFASEYSNPSTAKASYEPFDITDRANIPSFVSTVTAAHPDIDCIMLNAGVQSMLQLGNPAAWNGTAFHQEINTNFSSLVDLSQGFLGFLKESGRPAALLLVGSHLGFVPAAGLPAYSASKAALAAYALCLREQLTGSNVKVIDLWPPPVQTELHDYMGEEKGRSMGMPVADFVKAALVELKAGHEAIIIGTGPAPAEEFNALVYKRNDLTSILAAKMRSLLSGK